MVAQRTRDYEMVLVLSPEATEEEISATVDRVNGNITDRGGNITDHENWGVRRLAFPIMNFGEGNYVLTRFKLDTGAIADLNRTLEASEDILRFLVTRV